jgi:hypothetical protein
LLNHGTLRVCCYIQHTVVALERCIPPITQVEYKLDVAVGGNSSGYTEAIYYTRDHGFPAWRWTSVGALVVTLVTTASIVYGLLTDSSPAGGKD